MKGCARRVWDGDRGFDRVIDGGAGELHRQRWRRWGERGADRGSGHADRAEIIGLVVGGMVLRPVAIRRSDRCDQRTGTLRACPVRRVNVTKRQGKIDGERQKRNP